MYLTKKTQNERYICNNSEDMSILIKPRNLSFIYINLTNSWLVFIFLSLQILKALFLNQLNSILLQIDFGNTIQR